MLIDWFTVAAQALNFIVLVWLMKYFLYRPILDAIDAREKRIAAKIADSEAKEAEARKERDAFQHKNEEFDVQRATLLRKATDEATAERGRLLDEARKAAEVASTKRRETLRNEAHDLDQAIGRRIRAEVFSVARKALMDLATTSLEARMSEAFIGRLQELDGEVRTSLGAALTMGPGPVLVRSAFELPVSPRAAIQKALDEISSAEVCVLFEAAPDLIGGIELSANGQKVAWSIDDYLGSLEKSVSELLAESDDPEPTLESEPVPTPKGEADERCA